MAVKSTKSYSVTNPTLEDLRVLVYATTDADGSIPVRITHTPRDRPFDSEQSTVTVSYERPA